MVRVRNSALSLDTDFEPAPKVKVLSAILFMSYRHLLFQGLGVSQLNFKRRLQMSHVQLGIQESEDGPRVQLCTEDVKVVLGFLDFNLKIYYEKK